MASGSATKAPADTNGAPSPIPPARPFQRSGSIAVMSTSASERPVDVKNALFTLKISRPPQPTHGAKVQLKYTYYSRQSLLARILSIAGQRSTPPLPFARAVFETQSRVTYSDLRVIDPSMDTARKPTITLRHKCLIISVMPIHAVILPDCAFIFPQPGADGDLAPILEAMDKWSYIPSAHVLGLLGPMPPLLRAMPSMARITDGLKLGARAAAAAPPSPAEGLGSISESSEVEIEVEEATVAPLSDEIEAALRRWNTRIDSVADNCHVQADFMIQFVHAVTRAVLQAAEQGLAQDLKEMAASVATHTGRTHKATPDVRFEEIQHTRAVCTEIVDRLERAIRATETMQEDEEPQQVIVAGTKNTRSIPAMGGDDTVAAESLLEAFDAQHDAVMAKALDISDEMFDDFAISAAHTLSDARLELQRLDVERKRLNVSMASARNLMMRVQILLQLITTCFAFCSMLSGYFGMNLDNGGCGPDGCHSGSAADHGYSRFMLIVTISASVATVLGIVAYGMISRTVST